MRVFRTIGKAGFIILFLLSISAVIIKISWTTNTSTNTAVCTQQGDQLDPRIIKGTDKSLYIFWWGPQPGNILLTGIYGQKLDPAGNPLWSTSNGIPIIESSTYNTASPVVEMLSNGNILVAYFDQDNNPGGNIKITLINGNGAPIIAPVTVCNNMNVKSRLQLTKTSDTKLALSWIENTGSTSIVFAQKVDTNAALLWQGTGSTGGLLNGVKVSWLNTNQHVQEIASTIDGGLYIAFLNAIPSLSNPNNPGGVYFEVRLQKLDSNGTLQFTTDGLLVSNYFIASSSYPRISCDGFNNLWIVFETLDSPNDRSIRIQGVNQNGQPLLITNGINILPETAALFANQHHAMLTCFTFSYLSIPVVFFMDERSALPIFGGNPEPRDIYMMSFLYNPVLNTFLKLTPPFGAPVCTAPKTQQRMNIKKSESSYHVYLLWLDGRNANSGTFDYDIYGQKMFVLGSPMWTINGVPVSTAPGPQGYPTSQHPAGKMDIVQTNNGMVAVWQDLRTIMSIPNWDIYAQFILD